MVLIVVVLTVVVVVVVIRTENVELISVHWY